MKNKILICLRSLFLILVAIPSGLALETAKGDLIIGRGEPYNGVFLLRRNANYNAELLWPGVIIWPRFCIDGARTRIYANIYYQPWGDKSWYLDLGTELEGFEPADFVPEGMWVSSAPGDGSCLILYADGTDDIFAEENPLIAKPRSPGGWVSVTMLYRYDMGTGAITRLTYSHSQADSWVSDDGRVMAYLRYSEPYIFEDGWDKGYDRQIIFCRTDGTGKYGLCIYFAEAGFRLLDYPDAEIDFAPKKVVTREGETEYCAVFRPYEGEYTTLPGKIEYYVAFMHYEGEWLKCKVEKRNFDLPDGIALKRFYSAQSNSKEIYFVACEVNEPESIFLMRYDVEPKTFFRIPNSEGSRIFFVY